MKSSGVEPSVISYNAAISACEKGGQWEPALQLLEEMKSSGIEPDVISYSAAISACEKGGRRERVLELLDEINAESLSQTSSRTAPPSVCVRMASQGSGRWS